MRFCERRRVVLNRYDISRHVFGEPPEPVETLSDLLHLRGALLTVPRSGTEDWRVELEHHDAAEGSTSAKT